MFEVSKSTKPGPRICLIYGAPGVGKTTYAAGLGSLIVPFDVKGVDDIAAPAVRGVKTWDMGKVDELMKWLWSGEHKVVALDTITDLARICEEHVCREHGWKDISEPGWGKGEKAAAQSFASVLRKMMAIHLEKGVAFVLIAHSTVETVDPPDGEAYTSFAPELPKRMLVPLRGMCDEIFFMHKEVVTQGDSSKKKVAALGERVIQCDDSPGVMGKNRCGLGSTISADPKQYLEQWQNRRK